MDIGISGIENVVEIGRGGFAVVYSAYQPAYNRTVAIKVLMVVGLDDTMRRRFQTECRAMGSLSFHPGIVTMHEAGFTSEGKPYLVMERMSGSLSQRVKRSGPLGWRDAVDIGVKLAAALETAHRSGVLHRDVKPANVLISGIGEPQLSDFGIARVVGGPETRTGGAISGTIAHAAPEVLEGLRPTFASDVYSLGSTLFEIMAGTAPFARDTDESIVPMIRRIATDEVPELGDRGVPLAVFEVLRRTMEKDPSRRPQTAAEVGEALQEVQRNADLRVTNMILPSVADDEPPVVIDEHSTTILPPADEDDDAGPADEPVEPQLDEAQPHEPDEPDDLPPDEPARRRVLPLVGAAAAAVALTVGGLFAAGVLPPDSVTTTTPPSTDPSAAAPADRTATIPPTTPLTTAANPPTTPPPTSPPPTEVSVVFTPSEIFDMHQAAALLVEGVGCGFGLMATAVNVDGDVVSGAVAASSFQGSAFPGALPVQPIGRSTQHDLAMLDVAGTRPSLVPGAGSAGPQLADTVVILGRQSVFNARLGPFTAEVAGLGQGRFDVTSPQLTRTLEGAPVFGLDGELLGVVDGVGGGAASVVHADQARDGIVATGPDCAAPPGAIAPRDWRLMTREEDRAFLLAQYLASSLAGDDWPAVRNLEPSLADASDGVFFDGWGALEVSTLVPVAINELSPSRFELRVGLVAHERVAGQPETKLFCVTWEADLDAGTVDQTGRDARNGTADPARINDEGNLVFSSQLVPRFGHVNPAEFVTAFRDVC